MLPPYNTANAEFFKEKFMTGMFSVVFATVVLGLVALLFFRKILGLFSSYTTYLKSYIEHLFSVPYKSAKKFWCKIHWLTIGAVFAFFLQLFSVPIGYIRILLAFGILFLVVNIFIIFLEKDFEYRTIKIKFWSLGYFLTFLWFVLDFFLKLGKSTDRNEILKHFFIILITCSTAIYIKWKYSVLDNDAATTFCEGVITKCTQTKYKIIQIINYEYEYMVHGEFMRGIAAESYRNMEKRGSTLSGTQRVIYATEKPHWSKLVATGSGRVKRLWILWLVALLIATHSVLTTDVIQSVKKIPQGIQEFYEYYSDSDYDYSEDDIEEWSNSSTSSMNI